MYTATNVKDGTVKYVDHKFLIKGCFIFEKIKYFLSSQILQVMFMVKVSMIW